MLKNIFIAAMAASMLIRVFAFEGDYIVMGYDPYDKTDYTGSVSIIKDRNVYQAKWTIKEGGKQYDYTGTGLKIDEDTVSFLFKETNGAEVGLQVYMRTDDHTLQGPFVLKDKNLVGTETLKLR